MAVLLLIVLDEDIQFQKVQKVQQNLVYNYIKVVSSYLTFVSHANFGSSCHLHKGEYIIWIFCDF